VSQILDYAAIIDAELGRLGKPLPVEVLKVGIRGLDRRVRRLLQKQGRERFSESEYRAALRQVIAELTDNRDQLSRASADLHTRAEQILAKELEAQGRPIGSYSADEYVTVLSTLQRESAPEADPEESLSAWRSRRELRDSLGNFALANLQRERGGEVSAEEYLGELERLEALVAQSRDDEQKERKSLEERLVALERKDRLRRELD
jgi:hypothetical protein